MTAFDFFNIIRSIPKTLRFNLHYFPLKTALKLPVVVSHRTYLRELHGKVELPENIETAMVKIGFGDVGHYDRKRSRGIWQVSGTVSFGGKASIGHGSKLSVRGHLSLGADFNMTADDPSMAPVQKEMLDCRAVAAKSDNLDTCHDWGRHYSSIDFIWEKGFGSCVEYQTLTKKYGGRAFISDHFPVLAKLLF